MSRRHVVVVTTLPMLFLLGLVVLPSAQAGEGDDDPGAVAVLQRAVLAAGAVAFTGVQLISTSGPSGTSTRMLDVRADGTGRRWASVRLAGSAGSTTRTWTTDRQDASASADPLVLLAGAFTLSTEASQAVAGRTADVVVARRAGQVVARLWVDARIGLLLRQEVFDGSGALTRLAAFVEVAPAATVSAPVAVLPAPRTAPALTRLGLASAATGSRRIDRGAVSTLVRQAVPCPTLLPGGLVLVDARDSAAAGPGAVHLTYTDGLSALSLFVQPGSLDAVPGTTVQDWAGVQVHVASGWPTRLSWQGGDHVFTLVSDAPGDQQRAVVAALPHGGAGASLVDRVERGLRAAFDALPGRRG